MSTFATVTLPTANSVTATLPEGVAGPRWIVTDMDGTVLDSHHNLSQENVDAYLALRKAGVPVIPATGRSSHALRTVIEAKRPDLDFKYFPGLYCNGTVAYGADETELLYYAKMSLPMMRCLSKACYAWLDAEPSRGFTDSCMTVFLQHVEGALVDFRTPFYEKFAAEWFEEPSICLNKRVDEEVISRELKYNQFTIFVSEARMTHLLAYLREDESLKAMIEAGEFTCLNSTICEINCLPSQGGKAKGIELLIKRFGFDRSTLMTLGDGNNDLGMLRLAPYSVAMGQAGEGVKKAAKYLTSATDKHGWAEATTKMVLQRL